MKQSRKDKRQGVRYKIRKTISGCMNTPRLAVFRSNKQIYAQIIDDENGDGIARAKAKFGTDTTIAEWAKIFSRCEPMIVPPGLTTDCKYGTNGTNGTSVSITSVSPNTPSPGTTRVTFSTGSNMDIDEAIRRSLE